MMVRRSVQHILLEQEGEYLIYGYSSCSTKRRINEESADEVRGETIGRLIQRNVLGKGKSRRA